MKRSLCKRDEFTLLASHKLINEMNKKKKLKSACSMHHWIVVFSFYLVSLHKMSAIRNDTSEMSWLRAINYVNITISDLKNLLIYRHELGANELALSMETENTRWEMKPEINIYIATALGKHSTPMNWTIICSTLSPINNFCQCRVAHCARVIQHRKSTIFIWRH